MKSEEITFAQLRERMISRDNDLMDMFRTSPQGLEQKIGLASARAQDALAVLEVILRKLEQMDQQP